MNDKHGYLSLVVCLPKVSFLCIIWRKIVFLLCWGMNPHTITLLSNFPKPTDGHYHQYCQCFEKRPYEWWLRPFLTVGQAESTDTNYSRFPSRMNVYDGSWNSCTRWISLTCNLIMHSECSRNSECSPDVKPYNY